MLSPVSTVVRVRCPDTKREFFGNASGAEAEDWGLRYL
jgi:hypothetical protein